MTKSTLLISTIFVFASWPFAQAQEAKIIIHADQPLHHISRYLSGACIEDVNHEVYGGIDSQMIFGESFAEPVPQPPLRDFTAYGGNWRSSEDEIHVIGGDAPKLVANGPSFSDGEVSVELFFSEPTAGNAGLILKVGQPGNGRDQFNGYEVALEPAGNLVLGRHRQNWEAIRKVPCNVPLNEWLRLKVRMTGNSLVVMLNDRNITEYEDKDHPLSPGTVGLRTWQRDARFRNFLVKTSGETRSLSFEQAPADPSKAGVSGMWRAVHRGDATGQFDTDSANVFSGHQSQRLTFTRGSGEIGVENQSLNRWGMNFVKGKTYEGFLYTRVDQPTDIFVALESRDGRTVLAEKRLKATAGKWHRLEFVLKPSHSDSIGRFAIKLKHPGSVNLGYAFLEPGQWGRFKSLPVRKDVAEGLINQGVTVLRLGGCMANAAGYRWKNMFGPRENRPSYTGWWYPHSSNGWGIFDFLNFCEAANILGIPDVNCGESPQDMADFVEYVNGPADSVWGRKRLADGHPRPYHMRYLEIGNEEWINESYWQKFKPIAEAIWAKDPEIILIVGDFAYNQPIQNPYDFKGAVAGISSLAAHEKILRLAKQHNREVWFDVHVGTEGPRPDFGGTFSYIDALDRIADGAKHHVVIFEFNAGNHSQRRALANAAAINAVERDGRIPIVTSANCLQPDGQNDNDWNQGLLFLNPSQVWLQPPGYVTRMVSQTYQPMIVKCDVENPSNNLSVSAKRSEDGKSIVLQVVNLGTQPIPADLQLQGFMPQQQIARVETLSGTLGAQNTSENPYAIRPVVSDWKHGLREGRASYSFPASSFTILSFH